MNLIELHIDKLKHLCKKHKVAKLFVFGSILSDQFNKDSDIDLIVEFMDVDLNEYADNYFNLKFSLEDIFKREVDLLEEKAIKNPFLKNELDASRKLIYG
jgi:predicted nucleotidyltransferase